MGNLEGQLKKIIVGSLLAVAGFMVFAGSRVYKVQDAEKLNPGREYSYQMPRIEEEPVIDSSATGKVKNEASAPKTKIQPSGGSEEFEPAMVQLPEQPLVPVAVKPTVVQGTLGKAKAAAKKVAAKPTKKMKVAVTNTRRARSQMRMQEASVANREGVPVTAVLTAPQVSPNGAAENGSPETEEPTLSPSQWRALLQVQPTSSNVARAVDALNQGKIDRGVFFEIARELMIDAAPDRRQAGLLMVRSTPSVDSFSLLVQLQATGDTELREFATAELKSYADPKYLFITSRILATSKDSAVLAAALGNVESAVKSVQQSAQGGNISGSTSGNRRDSKQVLGSLNALLSSLRRASQTPELTNQAQSLTQSIEDLKKE